MKQKEITEVTFPASIPAIETAIKVHGEGGMRLMLDVSLINEAAFLPTLALRGCSLLVTLKVIKQ